MSAAEEGILSRLRTAMSPVLVHDTENPNEVQPVDPATPFSPFIALIWGGPIETGTGGRGIVNTRLDLKISYVLARIVAPDSGTNRLLTDKLYDSLLGWAPPDSSELQVASGMQYTNGSPTTKPTRYYREIGFTYRTNAAGMGSVPIVD